MKQTGKTPKGLRVFEGKYVELVKPVTGLGGKVIHPGRYRDLSEIKGLREEQAKLRQRREAKAALREVELIDSVLDPVKPYVNN